jgi:predicted CxxxxCH...CXXCH cytochrome family protein
VGHGSCRTSVKLSCRARKERERERSLITMDVEAMTSREGKRVLQLLHGGGGGWGTGRRTKARARRKMGWWLAGLGQGSCRNLACHGGGRDRSSAERAERRRSWWGWGMRRRGPPPW